MEIAIMAWIGLFGMEDKPNIYIYSNIKSIFLLDGLKQSFKKNCYVMSVDNLVCRDRYMDCTKIVTLFIRVNIKFIFRFFTVLEEGT